MNASFDLIGFLKVCAVVMVPFMVGVVWLLPKLLASKTRMKVILAGLAGAIFVTFLVILIGWSGIQLKNSWPTMILAAIIWGVSGFLIGAYFDVRLRSEFGLKSFLESRSAYALGFGLVCVVLSIPVGFVSGLIIMTWGVSFVGIIVSCLAGAVYGGLLGWILDRVVKR